MRYIFLLLFTIGCASKVKIADFRAHVTLPASGDGYWVNTVSDQEGRIPKAEWEVKKRRGIVLLSEDWAILRNNILENCLVSSCKDAVGVFDNLFYSIDKAFEASQMLKKK